METQNSGDAKRYAPYPLYLYIDGQRVVVVGGGRVAQRKVRTLLAHGAQVTVVAPQVTDEIRALAGEGRVAWVPREYRDGDLAGARLVFSTTDDRAIDEAVAAEAQRCNIFANVADVPDLCTAVVPSIMQRGRLQIAVSTQGASPGTARDIRRALEDEYPAWWEPYLDLLAQVRALIKQRVAGPASVRTPLYAAMAGDAEVRRRVAAGEHFAAEEAYDLVVAPLVAQAGAVNVPGSANVTGGEAAGAPGGGEVGSRMPADSQGGAR